MSDKIPPGEGFREYERSRKGGGLSDTPAKKLPLSPDQWYDIAIAILFMALTGGCSIFYTWGGVSSPDPGSEILALFALGSAALRLLSA